MLASEENIRVVAEAIRKYKIKRVVVDPVCSVSPLRMQPYWEAGLQCADISIQVMISTSNHQLLPDFAISAYIQQLLPLSYILTPNIPEALRLLSLPVTHKLRNLQEVVSLAKQIHALGPKYVLLKGGHLPYKKIARRPEGGEEYEYIAAEHDSEHCSVVDIIYNGTQAILIENNWINTKCTHGTGCSLSCS